ncbi:Pkinase-domain-containing protein [Macrolepiota fuliginosa MF-IS2]|uniref:Pkinase-domain-containing protein n=1 Tax=Macrolepiota fuliginosa MF-IS2 TaxID=1400762 RepID=A0A9P5XM16_9AGAR|nr:Pkinase-domain-containing protein [Macrolepiota fuliginosa MF-IS2]
MSSAHGHRTSGSVSQNHRAQLANAYNELGKELSSSKIRVVGNYTLGKVIGEGTYGKVRMGTHRLTSTRVAIKQIPKAMSANLTREIHHHRQLHHPHIAQMYEVIATESSIWIVTELCSGGELFDYLVEKGRLEEDETRVIFGQLCLAVAYLHESGIVHRDLKLENVLLDERCRIKLGDFGFTREYDKNGFMQTFCGTTGYASPEMLQGKRYQGPEVDVWSLGVILYCLLTGTLPFDDDDEAIMRNKIIREDFEDPIWLSLEGRDLIKNILQKDATKRIMIPQILTHPWFTSRNLSFEGESPLAGEFSADPPGNHNSRRSSVESAQNPSPFIAHPDLGSSTPTTPDDSFDDPFISSPETNLQRIPSDATIGKAPTAQSHPSKLAHTTAPVPEEDVDATSKPPPSPQPWSKAPLHPLRTPARTKRRSISSTLSSDSGTEKVSTPLPPPLNRDLDFASLLTQSTPIIFSTPLERDLLSTLSSLGLDTGQVAHSVLSNACDSAGAVWWMLKKKAERRAMGDVEPPPTASSLETPRPRELQSPKKRPKNIGVQTDSDVHLPLARSAPQLAFLPATPTTIRPVTPTRQISPTRSPMLSPSSSTITGDLSLRSHPSTPAGSLRDKEKDKKKPRSGSVSLVQRATTAIEAALVRKKSAEVVKDKEEKERDKSKDEPRSSHGSGGSSKLAKSPPLKASKDKDHPPVPVTPPPSEHHHNTAHMGSPWVLAESKESLHPNVVTPLTVGGQIQSQSAPNISETAREKSTGALRPRSNFLTAFRLWFHEDRKGKRKDPSAAASQNNGGNYGRPLNQSLMDSTAKRRGSNSSGRFGAPRAGASRVQRPSMSSRRSSSVNSRRSSGTSMQMIPIDSPQQVTSRRSFGSHTPNSERGDYSSRPSSIHSFSMQPRHRKSPSVSSASSAHFRTASPMQKYHRRAGSGSSTRVVRQMQPGRTIHGRSNSTTSSIHSPPSSRPTSWYEPFEGDFTRTGSPLRTRKRSGDRLASGSTMFVQKRQGPFMSPIPYINSVGRSSWKKSWGLEPPGWQTRTAHLPIEVLAISPASEPTTIRDVFSGRQSLSLGDESDWVDEEDDVPAFAGGLGQMGTSASTSSSLGYNTTEPTPVLSPAPRGNRRSAKRTKTTPGNSTTAGPSASAGGRAKSTSPVSQETATEARTSRRQLPATRSGPAFRQAIQEEDEDEEE